MKQKIINTLKGVAIGDAFGLGLEFQSRHWIRKNIRFDKYVDVRKGERSNIIPGTYSDDTEHTIGIAEALLSDEVFSENLLLAKFKNEYETDKIKKGYRREGHGSIEDWYMGKKTINEVREWQASRQDPGNAPVMRAVPLAFIEKSNVYAYSVINANATHPNDSGRKASLLIVLAAWYFLRDDGVAGGLVPFVFDFIGDNDIKKSLDKINALPGPDKLNEEDFLLLHGVQPLPYIKWDKNVCGLPCSAMKTALNAVYVLKHSTSAFEALCNSINMGGDVDSLAAVCTGICSGRYGLDSLPKFLLEETEGLARMEMLGEKLYRKFFAGYNND